MNWLTTSIGVSLSLVLAMQGSICVRRNDRLTTAGALNLVLAAIGLFLSFAVPSGAVVFSTEFSIVLVQGEWTTVLLQGSILAGCICGSLLWLTARKRLAPSQQLSFGYAFTVWAAGIVTGLVSCFQLWPLDSDPRLTGPVAVSYYALWFPLPVLWLILCFSQSVLALLQVHDWMDHAWYAVLLITGVGLYGLGWQEIGDPFTSSPDSRAAWVLLTGASFSAAVGLSVLRLLCKPGEVTSATTGWRRRIAALCSLATLGGLDYLFRNDRIQNYREPVMAAFILLAILEGGAAIRRGYRKERPARKAYAPSHEEIAALAYKIYQERRGAPGRPEQDWQKAVEKLQNRGPVGTWAMYIFSFLVSVVAATLFDLLYFSEISAGIDLLLGFAAFTVLVEFLAMGAFTRVPRWTLDFAEYVSAWARAVLNKLRGEKPGSQPDPAAGQNKTSPDPAQKGSGVWSTAIQNGLLVLLALAGLIAVGEVVHHGSTVIEPFSNPDASADNAHVGDQFAKLLVEDLGQVRSDIPELMLVSNSGGGPHAGQPHGSSSNLTIAADGGGLAAAVPGSNDVDLFGLKIPLGTLASLVQEPVRYLFNVEEITGGIYQEKSGNQTVWRAVGTSNRGKVWSTRCVPVADSGKTTEPSPATDSNTKSNSNSEQNNKQPPASTTAAASPPPAAAASAPANFTGVCGQPAQSPLAQGKQTGAVKPAANADANSPVCAIDGDTRRTPIERLAHELAVRMTVEEGASGMTSREDAFSYFDRGVESLKRFDGTGSRSALTSAIACFEQAVSVDHTFSDGYFRLADAFVKSNEPVRAAEAIRAILDNKPNDVKALLRRANIVFNLRNFYEDLPVTVPPLQWPSTDEATQLWFQASWDPSATPLQLHEAYLGICQAISTDEQNVRANAYTSAAGGEPDLAGLPEADKIKKLASISRAALKLQSRTEGYLPFYFCKRAEAVYASLPGQGDDPDAKSTEAGVLNSLGNAIVSHNQEVLRFNPQARVEFSLSGWFERIEAKLFATPYVPARSPDPFMFCDADDAPDILSLDTPSPGYPVAPELVSWGNSVSRYAVPYYLAAHRMAPEDTSLSCNYATAALYFLSDSGPMQALSGDLRQRLAIGYDLSRIAHEYADGMRPDDRAQKLAQIFYQLAVENYQAAVALNQESFYAVNDYAYGLFGWSVDGRSYGFNGPDRETIEYAETMAREMLRSLAPQRDFASPGSQDIVDLTTTLMEIEIADGKPGDAVKELESFQKEHSEWDALISSPYYFLDTSYAYRCASKAEPLKSPLYKSKAEAAWDRLKTLELDSESSPITGRPADFSPDTLEQLCFSTR